MIRPARPSDRRPGRRVPAEPMTAIDPYRTLGLTPGASQAEIKRAYRHLAKLYHPDSAGERALARFLAIQAAYEALVDDPRPRPRTAGRGATTDRPPRPPPPSWQADAVPRPGHARGLPCPDPAGGRSGWPAPGPAPAARGPASGAAAGSTAGAGSRRIRRTGRRRGRGRRDRSRRAGRRDRPPAAGAEATAAAGRATVGRSRGARRPRSARRATTAPTRSRSTPAWEGATWYGAGSGTYWTLNPKEYADPRKHGPEYLARSRRGASRGPAGRRRTPEATPTTASPSESARPGSVARPGSAGDRRGRRRTRARPPGVHHLSRVRPGPSLDRAPTDPRCGLLVDRSGGCRLSTPVPRRRRPGEAAAGRHGPVDPGRGRGREPSIGVRPRRSDPRRRPPPGWPRLADARRPDRPRARRLDPARRGPRRERAMPCRPVARTAWSAPIRSGPGSGQSILLIIVLRGGLPGWARSATYGAAAFLVVGLLATPGPARDRWGADPERDRRRARRRPRSRPGSVAIGLALSGRVDLPPWRGVAYDEPVTRRTDHAERDLGSGPGVPPGAPGHGRRREPGDRGAGRPPSRRQHPGGERDVPPAGRRTVSSPRSAGPADASSS